MGTLLPTVIQRALIALVRGYRLLLSPWLGSSCRFEPTCSAYSIQALEIHGPAVGTYMTLHRLMRCQPFCTGGHDPVPDRAPALLRHLSAGAPRAAGDPSSTSNAKPTP